MPGRRETLDSDQIERTVLAALERANLARGENDQLEVSPKATLFAPDSPLDSMSLVALVMDIEEALAEQGVHVTLADERAMSGSHSPFRDVPTLVAYIENVARF